ncbi:MAG: iron-containing alcohol dehydrogenase [Alphaproteobacteria bacterium]|nr:iron-containing alcohol dehydrogenase [Alphaproteobacteria bacterium]
MQIDPATLTGNWTYPTAIRFGPGRVSELADACRDAAMARPLMVTDPGLKDAPMVLDALAALKDAKLAADLFAAIEPNPLTAHVEAGVAAYRDGGHDGLIGFGGGSALDAAKAIALMVGQTRPIADFEDIGDYWRRADPDGIAPVIAVPTTAGTGSEVGRAAVVTDGPGGRKMIIFHPRMMPRTVIADPALTLGLPPQLTAATGMDALTHCLEAYFAPGFHPLADGVAVEGARRAAEWLPKAYLDGSDIVARANMMVVASMGATAFQKGLGGVHSISHAVGALYGTHHGLTNAVVLPYVMQFNRPAIAEKCDLLSRALDLKKPGFEGFFDFLLDLRATLKIPDSLADLEVAADRADEIAALAHGDPTRPGNPRPVSVDDLRTVFHAAVAGTI